MSEATGVMPTTDQPGHSTLRVRREVMRRFSVVPLAYSADGHAFGFQAPLTVALQAGTYVRIRTADGAEYLGQVADRTIAERDGPEISAERDAGLGIELAGTRVSSTSYRLRVRSIEGGGTLLGRITPDQILPTTDTDLFEDAEIEAASVSAVERYFQGRSGDRATLDIGQVSTGQGAARARLLASGFDLHTFLCVCAAAPIDPLQAEATERAIRIAGEGRKFGTYLLLSTQRPQKIHPNVLSQCDNLMLMRMNSAADIAELAKTFSFVPASLLERASAFTQGQSLVAGKIATSPLPMRFGGRISREGGGDIPATWATPRRSADPER